MKSYQTYTAHWLAVCFPPEAAIDNVERCDRFIEEALELVQAGGYSRQRAHQLVDYVFSRAMGDTAQELGGVMVTLAALSNAFALDIEREAWRELDRVREPETMAKIRAKQASKPKGSALPIATADVEPRAEVAAYARILERQLRANEHKGGWQNEKPEWLADRCLSSACDLNKMLGTLLSEGVRNLAANREALRRAAGNVGNYAMMLADVTAPGGLAGKPDGEAA